MREVARSTTGTAIYDAVQLDLDRPVTLTVLAPHDPRAPRFRAEAWPEHPHVVSLFVAGMSDDRFYIATRHVPGASTLQRRIADGADPQGWLDEVRATLVATGTVHGALEDEVSLVVDGADRVLITGFGLAPAGATAIDDVRALERLGELSGVVRRPQRPVRGRVATLIAGAAVLAVVALWLAVGPGGGDAARSDQAPAPAGTPGALALGSSLAAGPAATADCDGEPPSGRSPACTLVQRALPGRAVVVPRDGVLVAWHVRAARGEVALRVVRPRGTGRFAVVGGSDPETVDGTVRTFRTALPVRRGDRVGLELAPRAAAGLRTAVAAARTWRFIGPLRAESRAPDQVAVAGRDEELLLRVDVVLGRRLPAPTRLTGAEAAVARRGRRLDELRLDVRGGATVTVAVVLLPAAVAVDVFDGQRRRARVVVPGVDPGGRPVRFTAKGEADLTLGWRNPGGRSLETRFRVTADSVDLDR
ncbi:hypothetical protein [Paraconexibacter sp.]|uniref:hypothetical protein n=1 Tax=Paraconexibacter sp. TaxID=2949640 RepID=UPI003569CAAE